MLQKIVCINIHILSLCPLGLAAKLNFNLYQNTVYSTSSKYFKTLFRLRTVVKKNNFLQFKLTQLAIVTCCLPLATHSLLFL